MILLLLLLEVFAQAALLPMILGRLVLRLRSKEGKTRRGFEGKKLYRVIVGIVGRFRFCGVPHVRWRLIHSDLRRSFQDLRFEKKKLGKEG